MGERVVLDVARRCRAAPRIRAAARPRRRAAATKLRAHAHRALQSRVVQRLMRVFLELGRRRDPAHRPASGLPSPIGGPSAMPASTSATWRTLIGDALALKLAGHVHEAPEIAREHRVGAGRRGCRRSFRATIAFESSPYLVANSAAEAAADLRVGQFDQLQPLDAREQPPRLRLDAELAQARAGIVIGDRSVIARRDLLDAHDVDQEADQFVRLCGETLGLRREVRLAGEQFGIMLDQHAAA